ncbi:MAG: serine hydrolase [Candidatus Wallbacteria bacterium]|nr:serine hydrolase [Candidatus Wallbacteria bacterium]
MKKTSIILTLVAAGLLHTASAAGLSQETTDQVNRLLSGIQTRYKAASIAVSAVKDGQLVYSGAFGKADIGRGISAQSLTMYRIASISKSFAATALMTLYDQGKFQLNDDIGTCLGYKVRNPGFPDTPITFKQLLTHTSSIVDWGRFEEFSSATHSGGAIPDMKQFLTPGGKYYSAKNFGQYKPGSGTFAYSNFCFGLLGTLVEKLSGKRFDIYCREALLLPLDITGSFRVQDLPDINKLAVLYRGGSPTCDNYKGVMPPARDLSGYKIGTNGLIYGPQGSLRVNVREMAAFMQMMINHGLRNGKVILKPETVELMHKTHWTGNGMDGFYKTKGLGLHITSDLIPGVKLWGHGGDAYGVISSMYYSPENKIGVAIITVGASYGHGSGTFYNIEEDIAEVISSEILGL